MANTGCGCGCVVPHDLDPDLFDGREFLHSYNNRSYTRNECSFTVEEDSGLEQNQKHYGVKANFCGATSSDSDVVATETVAPNPIPTSKIKPVEDLGENEKRNIVARGMKRFEIEKHAPPQPEVEYLSERVVCVLGGNPSHYTLNGTNCYLVGTGKKRILIDTGEAEYGNVKFLENLDKTMKAVGCESLQMILITHLHGDHFGGVNSLLQKFGPIPVGMFECPDWHLSLYTFAKIKEKGLEPYLQQGPQHLNPDGSFNFFTEEDMPDWPEEVSDLSWDVAQRRRVELQRDYWVMMNHVNFYRAWRSREGLFCNSFSLENEQIITTKGATLWVMFTPGHSENHGCFVLQEENSQFSGDHVLGYGTTVLMDLQTYMLSLRKMLKLQPKRLYCGHGPYIKDGTDLLTRYIAHREARENQVVEFLKEFTYGKDAYLRSSEIVDAIYLDTPAQRKMLARDNVEKILLKQWREGHVQCYIIARDPYSTMFSEFKLPMNVFVRRLDPTLRWKYIGKRGSNL